MQILNISSKSDDWRARRLSNFSADSFVLDGERIASVEGFIQGTKFPEGHPIRQLAFQSVGVQAKQLGRKAVRRFVWWRGEISQYGSLEHRRLIKRAICAKFKQNKGAMDALLATKEMMLIHDLGYPESLLTALPAEIFCGILMGIRKQAFHARK